MFCVCGHHIIMTRFACRGEAYKNTKVQCSDICQVIEILQRKFHWVLMLCLLFYFCYRLMQLESQFRKHAIFSSQLWITTRCFGKRAWTQNAFWHGIGSTSSWLFEAQHLLSNVKSDIQVLFTFLHSETAIHQSQGQMKAFKSRSFVDIVLLAGHVKLSCKTEQTFAMQSQTSGNQQNYCYSTLAFYCKINHKWYVSNCSCCGK